MNIFLRFAAETEYLPNSFLTKAYDARILYILSGTGELRFPDQSFPLRAGTLCYYPTGQSYFPVSDPDVPLHFITINFDFDREHENVGLLPPVPEEAYREELAIPSHARCGVSLYHRPVILQDMHRFRDDFLSVSNLFGSNYQFGKEAATARLSSLLWLIPDQAQKSPNTVFSKALTYISENYAAIHSNSDLGNALHYHPYHLNRLFRQYTGKTLHRYLLEFRLEKAASLLLETTYSIAEIAERVGFENADHFSHCFSKIRGITPTKYRQGFRFI